MEREFVRSSNKTKIQLNYLDVFRKQLHFKSTNHAKHLTEAAAKVFHCVSSRACRPPQSHLQQGHSHCDMIVRQHFK